MSDKKFDEKMGRGRCYICNAPLDPLTSNCFRCGYSQAPDPTRSAQDEGRNTQKDLASEIEKAKADLASKIKLPPKK